MATFTIYSDFVGKIDESLQAFISDTVVNMMNSITPVATSCLVIFVASWGWAMMQGMIQEAWQDGLKRIVRLLIFYNLATNIGLYNEFLADWLWKSPEALANIIAAGQVNAPSNVNFLDTFLSQFYDTFSIFSVAANENSTMGIPDFSLLLGGWIVLGSGVILTLYVAGLLIMAKMALAALLAVGPLFVLFATFESTKKFFDAWIGQIFTFIFTVMFTSVIIKIIVKLIQDYLVSANSLMAEPAINQIVPVAILSGIAIVILHQVGSMASALGGGVALSTLGSFGGAAKQMGNTLQSLRPSNMQQSYRKAAKDVQIIRSAFSRAKMNTVKKGQ